MAKYCEICNKGIMSGNSVSHSNRKAKRAGSQHPAHPHPGRRSPQKVDICTAASVPARLSAFADHWF